MKKLIILLIIITAIALFLVSIKNNNPGLEPDSSGHELTEQSQSTEDSRCECALDTTPEEFCRNLGGVLNSSIEGNCEYNIRNQICSGSCTLTVICESLDAAQIAGTCNSIALPLE